MAKTVTRPKGVASAKPAAPKEEKKKEEIKLPFRLQGKATLDPARGWTFSLRVYVNTDKAEGQNLLIEGDFYPTKEVAVGEMGKVANVVIKGLEKKFGPAEIKNFNKDKLN